MEKTKLLKIICGTLIVVVFAFLFAKNYTFSSIINQLMQHLREQQRFDVIPVGDTFYGPNKDIPVTVIELSAELKSFHEHLIQFLESNGASFDNPQFLKEHYGPHISIYGSRRVSLSEPLTIHSISIGHKRTDIENPPNRIIATIPLL